MCPKARTPFAKHRGALWGSTRLGCAFPPVRLPGTTSPSSSRGRFSGHPRLGNIGGEVTKYPTYSIRRTQRVPRAICPTNISLHQRIVLCFGSNCGDRRACAGHGGGAGRGRVGAAAHPKKPGWWCRSARGVRLGVALFGLLPRNWRWNWGGPPSLASVRGGVRAAAGYQPVRVPVCLICSYYTKVAARTEPHGFAGPTALQRWMSFFSDGRLERGDGAVDCAAGRAGPGCSVGRAALHRSYRKASRWAGFCGRRCMGLRGRAPAGVCGWKGPRWGAARSAWR